MIFLRALAAILLGVGLASIVNATLFLFLFGAYYDASESSQPIWPMIMPLAGFAALFASPAWLAFCVIVIAPVTIAMKRGGLSPPAWRFYPGVAAAGAGLMFAYLLVLNAGWTSGGDIGAWLIFVSLGGVGGILMGACWRRLVLSSVSPRDTGVSRG